MSTSLTRPASAQTAEAALARAETAYRAWSTLQADFVQTIINPMLGAPEVSRGRVALEPPSRFAMRFAEPAGDMIVADGTWLWVYTPSTVEDQVIKQPIPTGGSLTPNLVGQFVDRPLERYEARYLRVDTITQRRVDVVELTPKDPNAEFRRAEIAVDREDGLLRHLGLVERSGQRRDIVFRNIRTNVPLGEAVFRFVVPRGARVITP